MLFAFVLGFGLAHVFAKLNVFDSVKKIHDQADRDD